MVKVLARRRHRTRRTPRLLTAMLAAFTLILVACGTNPATSAAGGGPATSALGPGVRMGPVELVTSDLDGLQRFYTEGVGLSIISSDEDEVVLGTENTELFRLLAADSPDTEPDDFTQAGLYHSAFLFAHKEELAAAVLRTANLTPASFQGSSDHKVSKAFYFADPEGNGVELYADAPADTWSWNDGLVTMGSTTLDPNAFIAEHLGDRSPNTHASVVSMGHVHLRGGDLPQAEQFYEDGLGFAVSARSQGAIFLAANGYHHHLAVNTWSSSGAGQRPDTLGLQTVSVLVTSAAELEALAARLSAINVPFTRGTGTLVTSDPWGTQIMVRVTA